MANSLMLLGSLAGVTVAVATPEELSPDPDVVASLNGHVHLTRDPAEAAADAHAVYADVWVSMGDDQATADERRRLLQPYKLDDALLANARDDAIALHCLPAHPGEEISAEVLYGSRSAVWDQAENRLHAQKALLEFLLADAG
jgi:ornithine carbamoyltransferase